VSDVFVAEFAGMHTLAVYGFNAYDPRKPFRRDRVLMTQVFDDGVEERAEARGSGTEDQHWIAPKSWMGRWSRGLLLGHVFTILKKTLDQRDIESFRFLTIKGLNAESLEIFVELGDHFSAGLWNGAQEWPIQFRILHGGYHGEFRYPCVELQPDVLNQEGMMNRRICEVQHAVCQNQLHIVAIPLHRGPHRVKSLEDPKCRYCRSLSRGPFRSHRRPCPECLDAQFIISECRRRGYSRGINEVPGIKHLCLGLHGFPSGFKPFVKARRRRRTRS